jgi:hypothetical protein
MLELYMEVSMVGIHWIMIWTDIQLTSKPDTGKSLVGYNAWKSTYRQHRQGESKMKTIPYSNSDSQSITLVSQEK